MMSEINGVRANAKPQEGGVNGNLKDDEALHMEEGESPVPVAADLKSSSKGWSFPLSICFIQKVISFLSFLFFFFFFFPYYHLLFSLFFVK